MNNTNYEKQKELLKNVSNKNFSYLAKVDPEVIKKWMEDPLTEVLFNCLEQLTNYQLTTDPILTHVSESVKRKIETVLNEFKKYNP